MANAACASRWSARPAALLIAFVPCSARSAIVLALAGKYLGGVAVFALFVLAMLVIVLLTHFGADALINAALQPLTQLWLGLPVVLGVPLLFGVLRKELSLLMLYQALGSFEVDRFLDPIQLLTLLLFITFYVPCVSTIAVMLRSVGRRAALESVLLSVSVALAVSGGVRLVLLGLQWLSG